MGPRRFVEDSKWPRYTQVISGLASISTAGVILAYRETLLRVDWSDVGLLFTTGVLIFAVAAGIVIAVSQRAMVLYEGGLSPGELRLTEVLKREVSIAYGMITQGVLIQKHGEWIIKAKTERGRRILIVGSHFDQPDAVLAFLRSRLRLHTVA